MVGSQVSWVRKGQGRKWRYTRVSGHKLWRRGPSGRGIGNKYPDRSVLQPLAGAPYGPDPVGSQKARALWLQTVEDSLPGHGAG